MREMPGGVTSLFKRASSGCDTNVYELLSDPGHVSRSSPFIRQPGWINQIFAMDSPGRRNALKAELVWWLHRMSYIRGR